MEERSTIADKLLETLARQRDEGILTAAEYAARVEQLRVPAPPVADPPPAPAPPQELGDAPALENDEAGDAALEPVAAETPPVEVDAHVPAQVAEPAAPPSNQTGPDAKTDRTEDLERLIELAETKIAQLARVADSVAAPEPSRANGEGAAESQNPEAPQSRRRRFARKAKAPAAAEIQAPAPPPAAVELGGMSEEKLAELKDKLRGLELEGWQAVAEYRACGFYSNQLTDDGLLVLPDGSVLDKWEAAVSALNGEETWTSYRIEDERMVLLSAGCAALTYTATAQILEEPEYRAVITSVFVRRGDDWLIALRQETPVHALADPG